MESRYDAWFLLLLSFLFTSSSFAAIDTISPGQSLTSDQTLISKAGKFELGFFRPGNSLNYYIGIWFKKNSALRETIVWVVNRDAPLTELTSSQFKLLEDGNLVLLQDQIPVWSTNLIQNSMGNSSEAVLGDDGNFILRNVLRPSNVYWQSFDYPTNTFLPGGRIGYDNRTKKSQVLTSWKNVNDPSTGLYSLELDPSRDQFVIKWNLTESYWTSGSWNGTIFLEVPEMRLNSLYNLSYVKNVNESYFTCSVYNNSIFFMLVMDVSGQIKQYTRNGGELLLFWSQPREQCQVYMYCAAFGICNQNSLPFCQCMDGFEPRSPQDWYQSEDYNSGCVRRTSEFSEGKSKGIRAGVIVGIVAVALVFMILGLTVTYMALKKRSKRKGIILKNNQALALFTESGEENIDLPLFKLSTIEIATDNLSVANKIGEGGFGPVYKGVLPTGQEIAIKRLSMKSRQGHQEFMNEVILIAKLQHRNLVKLLGCCIEGEERMLIYEYMPNGSLDSFIFDKTQSDTLNWKGRLNVIFGITRGLLYLHHDSRLRVIHRDLKASNILIDMQMNPKISDFGMARIFGGDQVEENTRRVVGT